VDCNDADAGVWPGAVEACNQRDDDCDGQTDEGLDETRYLDDDGDGHGDPDQALVGCGLPATYVAAGDDCDDADDGVFPGAGETCGDGVDQDCDGADLACG
jgi:hypothetical protein